MLYPMLVSGFLAVALVSPTPLHAQQAPVAQADDVQVSNAWARASAGNATAGAAYVTVTGGGQPDQLVGANTPVAAKAEVHESFTDNGVMKMRPVSPMAIAPGKTVTFSPGGYHIMLMGLKQPLTTGQSFPLTLTFAHARPVTVDVHVQALGRAAPMGDHMQMGDHMHMQ